MLCHHFIDSLDVIVSTNTEENKRKEMKCWWEGGKNYCNGIEEMGVRGVTNKLVFIKWLIEEDLRCVVFITAPPASRPLKAPCVKGIKQLPWLHRF